MVDWILKCMNFLRACLSRSGAFHGAFQVTWSLYCELHDSLLNLYFNQILLRMFQSNNDNKYPVWGITWFCWVKLLRVAGIFLFKRKAVLVATFCGPILNLSFPFFLSWPKSKFFLLCFNVPLHISWRKKTNVWNLWKWHFWIGHFWAPLRTPFYLF